jgi:hypothetical protein
VASSLTCYRYGKPGGKDACSYFAPVKSFAITHGTVFAYDVALTLGTVEEIRAAFAKKRQ